MHDTGKGYNMGDPQKFFGALLQNAITSGKDPSPKAKLPPAYLDLPATSPLINSCTRKYRDWTEGCPAPEGNKHATPEEHFVWLSKDYTPYDNDPGFTIRTPGFHAGTTTHERLAPLGQGTSLGPGSEGMPQIKP